MQDTDDRKVGRFADRGAGRLRRPRRGRRLTAAAVLLCLGLTTVGGLLGLVWSTQRGGEVRTAEVVVLLRPLEGNAFNPSTTGTDLLNMETEAQLVSSSVVASLAADRLGAPEQAGELRDGLDVAVPPNTQLVAITTEGSNAQEAVDRAEALAETFLAFRGDRAESDIFDRSARLREEIRTREALRRQIVSDLGEVEEDSAQGVIRRQRISELTTQLGEFRLQLAEFEAASQDPGQVVTTAAAAGRGPLGQPWVLPLLGGLLGLGAALLLLGGRRRLDERVHGPEDLADGGVPVLGRLPWQADQRPRAIGEVRAAILAVEPARPFVLGVAAVSAPDQDQAVTTTSDLAAELSLSLRRSGMVVAVLDLATSPGQARSVDDAQTGHEGAQLALSVLLDAVQDVPGVLARRRAAGLPLAVVNDLGDGGLSDRASSPEMGSVLDAMRRVADAVVVDIGSLDETSGQSLVGAVDGVVLTLAEGTSTFRELETSLERLPRWGGRLSGLVLAGVEPARRGRSSAGSSRKGAPRAETAHAADAPPRRPAEGEVTPRPTSSPQEPR